MQLKCKREAIDESGRKVMQFTKGKSYEFKKSHDPEGYETTDDNGRKEVFFDLSHMFTTNGKF